MNEHDSSPLLIMFDDGSASDYSAAYPYMQALGLKGTSYIRTGEIGNAGYMTAVQLQTLNASGIWAIGNHTRTHTVLTTLNQAQQETELDNGRDDLVALGIDTGLHVAYPGGMQDANTLLAMAAQGMLTGRISSGGSFFPPPANSYLLQTTSPTSSTTLAQLKATIDAAMNTGQTLCVLFHGLVTSAPDTYDWLISDFEDLMDYIAAQGYDTKTITEFYTEFLA